MSNNWIYCPVCNNKTRTQIREETIMKSFPLFCPRCKRETLIDVIENHIAIVKEPDVKTQSR
ncbi:MAG: cysteine-rich KTR domain-containing protein [Lachnospiraceae bacterium]|nr:cysteine-rich KTR domain-containing protein [Lachnospiraceae bacterium]